jgi:hypothetical protein
MEDSGERTTKTGFVGWEQESETKNAIRRDRRAREGVPFFDS